MTQPDMPKITIKPGGIGIPRTQLLLWIPDQVVILQVHTRQGYPSTICRVEPDQITLMLRFGEHSISDEDPDYPHADPDASPTKITFLPPGPGWDCLVHEGGYTCQVCWYRPTSERVLGFLEDGQLAFYRRA